MKRVTTIWTAVLALLISMSLSVSADTGAADDLMVALKACNRFGAMKSAQAMVKKHGGKPTDDQVDNWVDEQDDKLFNCLDKKL